ncbi:MAG: hypothetical protein J1E40_08945 [Oscillospiraceae bacterium]|nr:hypothetical protein [Oscillospiraceae bacterium]
MQKVRSSLKIVILIAIIMIPVLAAVVKFTENYVIIDDYSGMKIYNIDTTTELEMGHFLNWQIKRLKNLNELTIYQEQRDDLSFLKNFDNLEYLHLTDETPEKTADIDTLPAISNLNTLLLTNYTKKGFDSSSLGQLSSLEILYAFCCNLHDWSFVENMPNLKYVSHVNYYGDTAGYDEYDWTPLGSAVSLEEFEVTNVYYDKELLEALEKLPSLNRVYIYFYKFQEFTDEESTYIFDWIERMEEKGIECKVGRFNYDV